MGAQVERTQAKTWGEGEREGGTEPRLTLFKVAKHPLQSAKVETEAGCPPPPPQPLIPSSIFRGCLVCVPLCREVKRTYYCVENIDPVLGTSPTLSHLIVSQSYEVDMVIISIGEARTSKKNGSSEGRSDLPKVTSLVSAETALNPGLSVHLSEPGHLLPGSSSI